MAKEWEYYFAGEIKKRDNPKRISNCVGLILAVGDEWKVSIQGGKYIIDKSNGYICEHILARSSEFDLTDDQSGTMNLGACTYGKTHEGAKYSANGKMTGHVNLHAIDKWAIGNKVMVSPCEDNQHFFIVDIVRA